MRIATSNKREEQLKAINKDLRKRINKAIKRCDYLLGNDIVDINGRPYVRTDDDEFVIEYIKSTLEGVEKE